MDIRQLSYFVAIAELGSLSGAALHLNISQPTLSQHLAELEQHLGVQLMIRGPRGMTLTAEGEIFLGHARWIRDRLRGDIDRMRAQPKSPENALRLGVPPSVAMVLAVPLAETVRHEMPDLRLRLIEAMTGHLKLWLDSGTLDLALLYDLESVTNLRATHILDEELCFISAPDDWPFATPPGNPVRLGDLAQVELTLPGAPHGLRRLIDRSAEALAVTLNVVLEIDAMTQIKELTARGSAHSVLTAAACQDYVESGRLITAPITDPKILRPLYLVQGANQSRDKDAQAILALTRQLTTELVARALWH